MTGLDSIASRYDAVIVGARCAGAATALLLAREGLAVLVVDRGAYGADTLSTHALMRAGVLQLSRWGLVKGVVDAGTPAVRSTAFHYGDEVVEIAIKPRDGVEALYAPRRSLLDRLLVDAARAAGAEVRHQARATALVRSASGRVCGLLLEDLDGRRAAVDAGIVIGADGMRSTIAGLAGAEATRTAAHTASTVYGYWSGLGIDGYHWHYQPGACVGVIPTNDGQVCVFTAMSPERFAQGGRADVAALLTAVLGQAAPALAERVQRGSLCGSLHGFAGLRGYVRRSHGPGWALVGDAGYFKDPITAHGISDALRDAELLARAVLEGSDAALDRYEAQRDELSLPLFEISSELASFEWNLDRARELHLVLSREMNREVKALLELASAGRASAPAA